MVVLVSLPITSSAVMVRLIHSVGIKEFFTSQPSGIPFTPVGSEVISLCFINVPVLATPLTQLFKQLNALISVASIVI